MKTKLNRKIPALVFCLLFSCLAASAQQFTAKGVVVDSEGYPVIGGGVALKGNETVGTVTDLDGNFALTVPDDNAVLVVSFIGMETSTQSEASGCVEHATKLSNASSVNNTFFMIFSAIND